MRKGGERGGRKREREKEMVHDGKTETETVNVHGYLLASK